MKHKIVLTYSINNDDPQRAQSIYEKLKDIAKKYHGEHAMTTSTYLLEGPILGSIQKEINNIYIIDKVRFNPNDSYNIFAVDESGECSAHDFYHTNDANGAIHLRWSNNDFTEHLDLLKRIHIVLGDS